ncbi:uncharacterized protein DSM5745_06521 [Aspergillus mulundensis]|uniref:Uncharacterized protein n=1 Tax=Aspergillus mulundensis TaxID=1810919 RepID=A0A3D8RR49_9EURO|nr:hypothetical protein DSM5745_06521 [Aspergillus mulundensis]RDW76529.1 hypothetical protein DSM5745_06521 [Aspergillus mulundensis]
MATAAIAGYQMTARKIISLIATDPTLCNPRVAIVGALARIQYCPTATVPTCVDIYVSDDLKQCVVTAIISREGQNFAAVGDHSLRKQATNTLVVFHSAGTISKGDPTRSCLANPELT